RHLCLSSPSAPAPGSTLFPYTTPFRPVGLEKDLPVGDRDDAGGNVGGHVTRLRLDHAERRQGSATHLVGQLGRALQKTAVQVEQDRKSTRLNSSHGSSSYAVFYLNRRI